VSGPLRLPARDDFLEPFLGRFFHDPAVGILRAAEAGLVSSRPVGRPLLDVGCGDGSFAAQCLDRPVTVGIDRSWRRARKARASGAYRAVVVADAHRLPFRDRSFAAVLSNSTLEHIPGIGDVLREIERVLRPQGDLLFTVHNQRFSEQMFFWPRLFTLLGRPRWTAGYRRARLRRLAMANLLTDEEWQRLLEESGLRATLVHGYLSGRANQAFERYLVLARFGLGRANLGAALRVVDRALVAIGIRFHRRVLGRLLARAFAASASDREGPPAALLIAAAPAIGEKIAAVEMAHYRVGSR